MSDRWVQLSVSRPVAQALVDCSFTEPTPIQREAIPAAIRDGADVLGAAETGSGKTLAFGIPLIEFVIKEKANDRHGDGPLALVLSPTRELAIQIEKHLNKIAKATGVSLMCLVGGLALPKQQRLLNQRRPDVLIATPGRLWDIIEAEGQEYVARESVQQIKFVVVDEADRMTQKGHFEELIRIMDLLKSGGSDPEDADEIPAFEVSDDDSDVEDLNLLCDGEQKPSSAQVDRQTLVFSATLTFVPNRSIGFKDVGSKLSFLQSILNMREGKIRVIDLTAGGSGKPDKAVLTEYCVPCKKEEKDLYLYYFLTECRGKSIVFCNSKDCLRRLISVLRILELEPVGLHADMDQKRRLVALEKFTAASKSGLLVASDVACRGLDIIDVENVIHYQVPRNTEVYVHRSGRTARAARTGTSLLLVDPSEAANYSRICQSLNKGQPYELLPVKEQRLKSLRKHVELAKEIDVMEHRCRKSKAELGWFTKMARDADIVLDDRPDIVPQFQDAKSNRPDNKLLSLKKTLSALLRQRKILIPKDQSRQSASNNNHSEDANGKRKLMASGVVSPVKKKKKSHRME